MSAESKRQDKARRIVAMLLRYERRCRDAGDMRAYAIAMQLAEEARCILYPGLRTQLEQFRTEMEAMDEDAPPKH
jgi:hypothetical protein